jgi:hypothetical protein
LTNTIAQIIFRAPGLTVGGGDSSNIARVEFVPETRVLLNDGFGTEANLQTLGAEITLNQTVGSEIVDDWRNTINDDSLPPEEFTISLEKDQFAFEGKHYISFNTTDKQSGISHYEVLEEKPREAKLFSFGAANAPWIEARSPYILKDQSLGSIIRVKAVDKAGNEYIATLQPSEQARGQYNYLVWIGIGLITLLIIIGWFYWRRRIIKKSLVSENGLIDS